MLVLLAIIIWLSIGILYHIYALGDYWKWELEHPNQRKIWVFLAFIVSALVFPLPMAVNYYDSKYR